MKLRAYPDFLLIGAARAGTTAVDRYLRQHPQVFLPRVKEPCFFSFAGMKPTFKRGKFAFAVTEAAAYEALYASRRPGQVAGDLSTPYLFLFEQTIAHILQYHPAPASLRVVAMLRQPVDRAYSQYRWRLRDGREELSFQEAVSAESRRKEEGYSFDYLYMERSFYAKALRAYQSAFPRMLVLFYDDLRQDPLRTMRQLCDFIGVDSGFDFREPGEVNGTWSPRSPWLSRLVTWEHPLKYKLWNRFPEHWRDALRAGFARVNAGKIPDSALDPAERLRLTERFREDIREIENMTGKDLSGWWK